MAMLSSNSAVSDNLERFVVVSYNLHGYNQGSHGVKELIAKIAPSVILIQEHWLTPDNLYKLNSLSEDYFVFASSAMNATVCSGPLIGRPFGGTAILVNKSLVSLTTNLITTDRFTAVKISDWLFVSVYLPCAGTTDRDLLYSEILSQLQALIDANNNGHCCIAGDYNTDLDCNSSASVAVNNFIRCNNLSRCDVLFSSACRFTYVNETTNAASVIDYIIVSNVNKIIAFNVLDIDINLSDHMPIMAICNVDIVAGQTNRLNVQRSSAADITHLRWDHAHTDLYYDHTRQLLQPVSTDLDNLIDCSINRSIDVDSLIYGVDRIYKGVVEILRDCANMFIPKHKKNFYKFWWTQELNVLKEMAISSCRAWKDAGKPKHGNIFQQYKKDKLLYKKRMREEQVKETSIFTNDLHDALQKKHGQDFWKVWNSKFENKVTDIIQVDGIADCSLIVNNFAKYFESCCMPFNNERNIELKAQYEERRADYVGCPINNNQLIDVELLSNLIFRMKKGKAAGLDELSCEHLMYCHPIIVIILSKLFNLFIELGHVPQGFGASYTVPIPKCDGRTRALSVDDFRGISISPVISKLFELAILDRFGDFFTTSDHQFGFKKNIGCRDAIYCVRNIVDHFISHGSTVNLCTLDLSKAFDRMNHYVLFLKLMDRNLPAPLLTLLEIWFSISATCVKWCGHVSYFFRLRAGVRQGGVLSPLLFSLAIDSIVCKIKLANIGCYRSTICCSIFLYADDILLLSPTVTGLQILLSACEKELIDLDMRINAKKSSCIRFGSRYDVQCRELETLDGSPVKWVDNCRYLGVSFASGRTFRCCYQNAKADFFRAFNSIFGKVGRAASEEVVISLIRAKCLPILLYATEVCPLLSRNVHSLEFTVTRLFMKLFRTGSAAVVKECQFQFKFLPIKYQLNIRTARFLQKFVASSNGICCLFTHIAGRQLNDIFAKCVGIHKTADEYSNAIYSQFADGLI